MARVKRAMMAHKRHVRVLKLASGYWGGKHRLFKTAKEAVAKSGNYAYKDRRLKKRDFRRLWIARINIASRMNGLPYGKFIEGLNKSGIEINRKVLAELAVNDTAAFTALVEQAKTAV